VPDPLQLSHQDRPDPAVLLIDAVINRQSDLAQRLSQQLVHRQGFEALERCLLGPLTHHCGEDSVRWLREQLRTETLVAQEPVPSRQAVESLLKDALSEALAPLRQDPATHAAASLVPALEPNGQQPSDDPWALTPLQALDPAATATPAAPAAAVRPAPLPVDLADLRAWLHSDAA